ncbi:ABC transporter permease [Zhihengliuella salsuginis]|uniref:Transport permease protein n=1 Tax=Zhihengliuella salsuginis TaxID=578222 RepID=A0ABQ3GK04_9MICC|nr:ABC transporter permease [Zhihengliuella salsuginis]GHD11666.1 transport permease protein [Zhihengliuella salsuginis]
MLHEARSKVDEAGKRQYLGNLWLIINPILDGAMFYFVFGVILNIEKGIPNFIAFLLVGVFFFQLTSKSVNSAAATLLNWKKNTSGAPLPPITGPLSAVVRVWLTGFPSYVVMVVMIFAISPPEQISWIVLLVLPVIGLQIMLATGIALVSAHFVGLVPDVQNLLRAATRAWMFGSGVMFAADRFLGVHPIIDFLVHWNPMYWVLEYVRSALVYNEVPVGEGWYIMALWAVLPLLVGSWLIWRQSDNYGMNGG